uniref:G-protein coupled receptors family 1 profile domain-containing protein n=1 Tax=Clastoptera arizonana TaxID=38151 RepID=A0A1B6DX19_9HEMI
MSSNLPANWTTSDLVSQIGHKFVNNWTYPMGLLSVLSNMLVLISSGLILKSKVHPRSTYMFLGNLALADLMHGLVFLYIVTFYHTIHRGPACIGIIGITSSYVIECSLSVCLIAVDRYIYIHHGLYYSRWMTTKRTRYILLGSWTLSLLIGISPQILFADSSVDGEICSFFAVTPLYVMILMSLAGLLPEVVTISLYVLIFKIAIKTNRAVNKGSRKKVSRKVKDRDSGISIKDEDKRNSSGSATNFNFGFKNVTSQECNTSEDANEQTKFKVDDNDRQSVVSNISLNINKSVLDGGNDIQKFDLNTSKIDTFSIKLDDDEKPTTPTEKGNKAKPQNMLKIKSTMIVFLAMCSFTVTWGPCFVCLMIYPIFCSNHTESKICWNLGNILLFVVINVGLLNALMNPIIYCWWHRGFRNSLSKVCCKKASRERRRNDFVISIRHT